jgi:hypothetical protein
LFFADLTCVLEGAIGLHLGTTGVQYAPVLATYLWQVPINFRSRCRVVLARSAFYFLCAATVLIVTALVSRRGLKLLDRPIISGFGPPCSLWQAWEAICSFFWEQMLLVGVLVSCSVRLCLRNFHWVDLAIRRRRADRLSISRVIFEPTGPGLW